MRSHQSGELAGDLRELGVEPGEILFIHASFKSLGPVEGGAATVISAIEDAVNPDGLILMPSFNLVEGGRQRRVDAWDQQKAPSTVGWLTEFFRNMPGTYRSDHYSHSVAARGNGAEAFVADHLSRVGIRSPWDHEPWGKTFGPDSPMNRAYQRGAKLLMLGVDYDSSTYVHFVESLWWNELLREDSEAVYPALDRPRLGAFWDETGDLSRGLVGDANCRLFQVRQYADALLEEAQTNSRRYLKE